MSTPFKKVLVVDDKEMMILFFRAVLKMLEGVVVIEAQNGQEAYDIISKEKVDLIISDINMPVMDGLEFLNKFKIMEMEIPFIFVSGNPSVTKEEVVALGASDFIGKPIFKDAFLKRIKCYLMK